MMPSTLRYVRRHLAHPPWPSGGARSERRRCPHSGVTTAPSAGSLAWRPGAGTRRARARPFGPHASTKALSSSFWRAPRVTRRAARWTLGALRPYRRHLGHVIQCGMRVRRRMTVSTGRSRASGCALRQSSARHRLPWTCRGDDAHLPIEVRARRDGRRSRSSGFAATHLAGRGARSSSSTGRASATLRRNEMAASAIRCTR